MSSVVGPMTRIGRGMPMGLGMEEGMGILREGHATSEDKAPSLGRGMGVGSTRDHTIANGSSRPADPALQEHGFGDGAPTPCRTRSTRACK